jgi:hypothetical protein
MKWSPRPRKTPSGLSESVNQRLTMYALAASAAGVSLLALSQPAAAKIVYTPIHHVIHPNQSFNLDLNHDGKGWAYACSCCGLESNGILQSWPNPLLLKLAVFRTVSLVFWPVRQLSLCQVVTLTCPPDDTGLSAMAKTAATESAAEPLIRSVGIRYPLLIVLRLCDKAVET